VGHTNKKTSLKLVVIFYLVTRTGFEPVNACVKGMCVNRFTNGPLKMAEQERFELSRRLTRPMPLAGAPLQPLEYCSMCFKLMAPEVGLEPTTDRLTADSSTTELLRQIFKPFYNTIHFSF
jgi:hypothetical protein